MLTNDATNRLDAIDDAMALVTLMGELISARRPGAELDLSGKAASGLLLVLGHVADVLGDAATGLRTAQTEIAAAMARPDHSPSIDRRSYTQGYTDACREHEALPIQGGDYLTGLRRGASMAYVAGWRDAGGDIQTLRQDWKKETVAVLTETALEERAEAASAPDVAPVLTEAIPPEEREIVAHDGQRQHA